MQHLLKLFFEIAILRKGPQDVPGSPWLLRMLLPVYAASNALIMFLNGYGSSALQQIAADFLLMVGFSWPLLHFAGKPARFRQTLAALVGTDIIISLVTVPAILILGNQAPIPALFAVVALMTWHWLVCGHIFRHALDRPLFFGLALALLYILISYQVMDLLFSNLSTQT